MLALHFSSTVSIQQYEAIKVWHLPLMQEAYNPAVKQQVVFLNY